MMAIGPEEPGARLSAAHWTSLRYFNYYRACLASLLVVSSLFNPPVSTSFGLGNFNLVVASFYLVAALGALSVVHFLSRHFNQQLSMCVLVDVVTLTLFMHFGGGLRSGYGVMLLVMLGGVGLVGQGRLVLFYAAIATVSVLLEQSYRATHGNVELNEFFQAGLFCAGFFGVAISARLLARRVIANEALAFRRGVDLHNQMLVSQRVIAEMQDGILVLSRAGAVRQHNPRSEELLGLREGGDIMLSDCSVELSRRFVMWCDQPDEMPILVRAPASGKQLRVRFIATESSEHDVLVLLEDMERLQEQARQLKLAALGRLTASIAHEIRNPLSAIHHAGELLCETPVEGLEARLLRIIIDNAQRVERIVNDVLSIGQRDSAHREQVDLRQMLPHFLEEYAFKEELEASIVRCEISGYASLFFDRSHLHQVLWNLLGNALRHSRKNAGSIVLRVEDGRSSGWVDIHVIDDGEGVAVDCREQIFEPFFTTHSRGTGLGLYIARELCEANGARLVLLDSAAGADFCISGRGRECR
ncbi:HAMP domain-containing sensor histidine kinase [uncultured Propionivibrio sp.]|uniref:sensor histidine kinase n=1 Tax=uncultured Propionivibrio sp. TaxID=426737 RepID=UPI0029C0DE7F|nr:HAMP domain-containing sensor histidine kinase [uncultured Propionivibrio sp.]